eukprot:scaffold165125_cov14-Tisochrysis_lutea.AAC.1
MEEALQPVSGTCDRGHTQTEACLCTCGGGLARLPLAPGKWAPTNGGGTACLHWTSDKGTKGEKKLIGHGKAQGLLHVTDMLAMTLCTNMSSMGVHIST